MPSAKTHLYCEMVIFGVCIFVLSYLGTVGVIGPSELGAFLGAYLFSSFFLSPDLDLSQSRAARRWGIGRVFWLPYSALFRHRRLSHHLIWGPLTRIFYLGGLVLAVFVGITVGAGVEIVWPAWPISVFVSAFCGLCLPNQIHIVVDRFWSMRTRRRHL